MSALKGIIKGLKKIRGRRTRWTIPDKKIKDEVWPIRTKKGTRKVEDLKDARLRKEFKGGGGGFGRLSVEMLPKKLQKEVQDSQDWLLKRYRPEEWKATKRIRKGLGKPTAEEWKQISQRDFEYYLKKRGKERKREDRNRKIMEYIMSKIRRKPKKSPKNFKRKLELLKDRHNK